MSPPCQPDPRVIAPRSTRISILSLTSALISPRPKAPSRHLSPRRNFREIISNQPTNQPTKPASQPATWNDAVLVVPWPLDNYRNRFSPLWPSGLSGSSWRANFPKSRGASGGSADRWGRGSFAAPRAARALIGAALAYTLDYRPFCTTDPMTPREGRTWGGLAYVCTRLPL